MPPLEDAYSAALGGGGQPSPSPMGMPSPAPAAAPAPQAAPVEAPDQNPMSQQGDIFFLDPAMLVDQKPKVGDEIMLKASIQSLGSKIGMQPIEVVMEAEAPGEDDGNEEGATDSGEDSSGY